MKLKQPVIITPRLLAGIKIDNAFVSIDYAGQTAEGRTRYRYHIDLEHGGEYSGTDLKSGCQGGTLQEGLESLLSFLGACAESYRYKGMNGENSDLFPESIAQWASQNSDEIGMLQCELSETPNLIEE